MTSTFKWDSPSYYSIEKVPLLNLPSSHRSNDWQIVILEYTPHRNYNYLMFGKTSYQLQTIKKYQIQILMRIR
jgi:hypothetical protein